MKRSTFVKFCEGISYFGPASKLGYVWESYLTKDINRGLKPKVKFLPVYGCGAVVSSLTKFGYEPLTLGVLEYTTSVLFDKDKKLWDYTNEGPNINGRVSLHSLLLFTAASWVLKLINKLSRPLSFAITPINLLSSFSGLFNYAISRDVEIPLFK